MAEGEFDIASYLSGFNEGLLAIYNYHEKGEGILNEDLMAQYTTMKEVGVFDDAETYAERIAARLAARATIHQRQ